MTIGTPSTPAFSNNYRFAATDQNDKMTADITMYFNFNDFDEAVCDDLAQIITDALNASPNWKNVSAFKSYTSTAAISTP